MSELVCFVVGVVCAAFPLTILWLHTKESRDYFERDRNAKDSELVKIRSVIRKCGPVTSEVRARFDCEGGWIKAWMPTAQDVMDGHALLAGRFDLIEPTRKTP